VANTRTGPPEPCSNGISPTTRVTAAGGIRCRSARFSTPYRSAPVRIRWVSKVSDSPGSMLSVSTPRLRIPRRCSSHSVASGPKPGKCSVPAASVPRYALASPGAQHAEQLGLPAYVVVRAADQRLEAGAAQPALGAAQQRWTERVEQVRHEHPDDSGAPGAKRPPDRVDHVPQLGRRRLHPRRGGRADPPAQQRIERARRRGRMDAGHPGHILDGGHPASLRPADRGPGRSSLRWPAGRTGAGRG
jgi:hypothetical protein